MYFVCVQRSCSQASSYCHRAHQVREPHTRTWSVTMPMSVTRLPSEHHQAAGNVRVHEVADRLGGEQPQLHGSAACALSL